jgi:hypothetical protein
LKLSSLKLLEEEEGGRLNRRSVRNIETQGVK